MSTFEDNLKTLDGREWLAMQFVLGELPERESVAFDAALTDDLELCELVAQAAQLIAGVATLRMEKLRSVEVGHVRPAVSQFATQSFIRRANNDDGVRRTWSVKAALLMVAVLGVFMCVSPKGSESTPGQVLVDLEAFGHDDMSPLQLGLDAVEAENDDGNSAVEDDPTLSVLEAPEWLMSAVELEQESSDDGSGTDNAGVL